ncbi:MAG: catechol 2,3-dioxygenase [Gammaproteobacteria bacterium]|jgi:catechol 2,3-dioxygenase
MHVQSLGHVVPRVRSLECAVPFYLDVLGLTEVGRMGEEMVFFSIAGNHHDIALAEVGDDAPDAAANAPGLAHLALKIGDATRSERASARAWCGYFQAA